jgi:hypothetical protein
MLALESRPLARGRDGVVSFDVMQTNVGEVEYHFIFVKISCLYGQCISSVASFFENHGLFPGCRLFIVVCILLDFICVCLFLMQVTELSPEETESTTGGYGLFKEIVIFGLVCSKRL